MGFFSKESMKGQATEASSLWHKKEHVELDEKVRQICVELESLWEQARAEFGTDLGEEIQQKALNLLERYDDSTVIRVLNHINERGIIHREEQDIFDGNHPSMNKWDVDPNARGINN